MVAALDQAFGADVSRNLRAPSTSTDGTQIQRATEVAATFTAGPGQAPVHKTLADAFASWHQELYPFDDASRRDFDRRWQRALHDHQPVVMSWFVDFNSLDGDGRFFAPPATPGHQGGHMVVMQDYQVTDVPGFGTLQAGVAETRPEALEAALSAEAHIEFIRIKNSWGSFRPDRMFVLPGYHDLYLKYLNGPVKECAEKADGSPDTSSCFDGTPFKDIVLPPGY
jgi:hypothetical protein